MCWLLIFSIFCFSECHETRWVSLSNSDWSNSANWDNGVPFENSTAIISDSRVTIFSFDIINIDTINNTNSRIIFANDAEIRRIFSNGRIDFKTNARIGQLEILENGTIDFSDSKANITSITNRGNFVLSASSSLYLTGIYNSTNNGTLLRNQNNFLSPDIIITVSNETCNENDGQVKATVTNSFFPISQLKWLPLGKIGSELSSLNAGIYELEIIEEGASGTPNIKVTVGNSCENPKSNNIAVIILGVFVGLLSLTIVSIILLLLIKNRKPPEGTIEEKNPRIVELPEDFNSSETTISIKDSRHRGLSNSSGAIPSIEDVEILRKLGEGNFGEVFLGNWHGTKVALKKIKTGGNFDLFKKEVDLLVNVGAHPQIVQVLGTFSQDEQFFLVMEYISRGSLLNLLKSRKHKLSVQSLMDIIISAAKGMAFLEYKKIVHRDFAARNLLVVQVDGKYSVKVSDFGLATVLDTTDYRAISNNAIPVRWSAPEVISGRLTPKSDVWSFAVVCWEILEKGALPYGKLSMQQIRKKVLNAEGLPQPPNCPAELYALLKQCWQLKPQDRPSFDEILKRLQKIYEEEFPDQNTMVYEENLSITNTSEASGKSPSPSQLSLAPRVVNPRDPRYISSTNDEQIIQDIKMSQEIDITPSKIEYGMEESVESSSIYTPAPKADNNNYHYDVKIAVKENQME